MPQQASPQPRDPAIALQHLHYEYSMVHEMARRLIDAAAGVSAFDQATTNAYVESFLVHVRAVMHVVGWDRGKPHPEDVLAEDFLQHWRTSPTPTILNNKKAINGRVAHLSYDRQSVDPKVKGWDVGQMADALLSEVERLVIAVHQVDRSIVGAEWQPVVAPPSGPAGPRFPAASEGSIGATGPMGPASTGSTALSISTTPTPPGQ